MPSRAKTMLVAVKFREKPAENMLPIVRDLRQLVQRAGSELDPRCHNTGDEHSLWHLLLYSHSHVFTFHARASFQMDTYCTPRRVCGAVPVHVLDYENKKETLQSPKVTKCISVILM